MADDNEKSVKDHIRRVIQLAEPEMFPQEVSMLADTFDASLRSYAAQVREGRHIVMSNALRDKRRVDLEKALKLAFAETQNAVKKQPPNLRAERRLRTYVRELMAKTVSGLTTDQERKVEDRIIRMLADFSKAAGDKKEQVYKLALEQVLATINPPAKSQGAAARSASN